MAEEMKGTNISSPVVPFTKEDRYATHDETFGRGGYRSVASVSEMNAIPTERRKEGMLVNVVGDKIYRLVNGSFVSAFKTINNQSILGSGDLQIAGGSGSNIEIVDLTTLTLEEVTTFSDASSVISEELKKVGVAITSGSAVIVRSTYKGYVTYAYGTVETQRYLYLEFDSSNGTRWRITIGGIVNSVVRYKMADISIKHDLSLDVKTGYDAAGKPKIYFRIREKVPNGRIYFVRKKKVSYSPIGTSTYYKRVTYAPMFLDVRTVKEAGMDVSNLIVDMWYEYPIEADDLIGSYPAGSDIEGSMNKRMYSTIRFKGNVHAKPLVYDAPSLTKNLTVLQAGLQYNVLSGQRNPLFKQRGDIVKIDVRLRAKSPTNYNLGYEYNYAVK